MFSGIEQSLIAVKHLYKVVLALLKETLRTVSDTFNSFICTGNFFYFFLFLFFF